MQLHRQNLSSLTSDVGLGCLGLSPDQKEHEKGLVSKAKPASPRFLAVDIACFRGGRINQTHHNLSWSYNTTWGSRRSQECGRFGSPKEEGSK